MVSSDELAQLGPILPSVLVLGLLGAFGEELGWRGFLLPKALSGGVRHPVLVTGLVWASWHLPLIAFGDFYHANNALLMALIYGLFILAWNSFLCELRICSGSVWTAAIVHAVHNFLFQFAVPALLFTVPGSRADQWEIVVGDSGLIIAALYIAAYLVFRRLVQRNRA